MAVVGTGGSGEGGYAPSHPLHAGKKPIPIAMCSELIVSCLPSQGIPPGSALYAPQMGVAPNVSGGKQMAYTTTYHPSQPPPQTGPAQPQQQQKLQPVVEMLPEDLEEFSKMFPAIEKTIIKVIYFIL